MFRNTSCERLRGCWKYGSKNLWKLSLY